MSSTERLLSWIDRPPCHCTVNPPRNIPAALSHSIATSTVAAGLSSEDAAFEAGVSQPVGT